MRNILWLMEKKEKGREKEMEKKKAETTGALSIFQSPQNYGMTKFPSSPFLNLSPENRSPSQKSSLDPQPVLDGFRGGKEFKGTRVFRKTDSPIPAAGLRRMMKEELEEEKREEEEEKGHCEHPSEGDESKSRSKSVSFSSSKCMRYTFDPNVSLLKSPPPRDPHLQKLSFSRTRRLSNPYPDANANSTSSSFSILKAPDHTPPLPSRLRSSNFSNDCEFDPPLALRMRFNSTDEVPTLSENILRSNSNDTVIVTPLPHSLTFDPNQLTLSPQISLFGLEESKEGCLQ